MAFVDAASQVQTSKVLSTFATEYKPRGLIGANFFTRVPVANTAGKYRTRNKANLLRELNVEVGAVGMPAQVSAGYGSADFACENYAAEADIPKEFEAVADATINLRADATRQATTLLMLAQERRFMTLLTSTSSYATGNYATLSGTDQWSDLANSDPFDDIRSYRRAIYRSPDAKLVGGCSQAVWDVLQDHPDIVERVKYGAASGTAPAMVTQQSIAALFGLDAFYVSDLLSSTTNPGQTATYASMWGKDFWITAVEPSASTMSLGFGGLFVFQDVEVSEVFDGRPGLKGITHIKAAHSVDEVVSGNDAGMVLKSVVA